MLNGRVLGFYVLMYVLMMVLLTISLFLTVLSISFSRAQIHLFCIIIII